VKAFLENFAAIVGVFTLSLLAMSWAHEYGYFWSIGRQFQTFLSTTDYLTNDVLWLPLTLFSLYGLIDWWRLKEDAPPTLDWMRDWKRKSTWLWIAGGLLTLIGWVIGVTWPISYLSLGTAVLWVTIIWSYAWRRYLPGNVEAPWDAILRQTIRLGPPFLIGMFLYGSVDANRDLTRTDEAYVFQFKGQQDKRLRIFLRTFDKGLLTRNPIDNTLEFYKWDDVASISRINPGVSRPLACWVTGWMCGSQPPVVIP
jgi:hypothetical protein